MGNSYNDLNYVDYSSAAYKTEAEAKNLTIPVDYYLVYIPQKTGDTWDYKNMVCQSNYTMCSGDGSGGGSGIGLAIFGGIIACCGLYLFF